MNPKTIAESFYTNLGKYDLQNARRLRLAACAQLGRTGSLKAKAKDMGDKKLPPEKIKLVEDEALIREKLAEKLALYSTNVDKAIATREQMDVEKKKKKP